MTDIEPIETDSTKIAPKGNLKLPEPTRPTPVLDLTRQEKAAIIIGALGSDTAGPILEQFDESSLRSFTSAMAKLRRVDPNDVRLTIAEFLDAVNAYDDVVRGGIARVREVLGPHIKDSLLNRILDDIDAPSVSNVWKKLAKVSEDALADFLGREHPQTASVILSKLGTEQSAKVLSQLDPERAREVIIGITRTSTLDARVIEAIGASVSRDFLTTHQHATPRRDPAERVGSILNFTTAALREKILSDIEKSQPEFAEEIRRKMFTFEDIPARLEQRDVPLLVREVTPESLIKALRFASDTSPEAVEFVLSNISSRIAEQMREDIGELDRVRRKDGETAQAEVISAVRALETRGQITLIALEEEL